MKNTLEAVRTAKESLLQFMEELPDLDANSMVYSIAKQTMEKLDICLQDLPPAMEEAKETAAKYPNLLGKNRFG